MPQTSTTVNLSSAMKRTITAARYTAEHNAVASRFVTTFKLDDGNDRVISPKVGQFTLQNLSEGVDISNEQAIGMSTVTLTTGEVGGKIIITDVLERRNGTTDVYRMIGKQFGDAEARKKDTDIHAFYSALNGGTTYGLATVALSVGNLMAMIAKGRGKNPPFRATYAVFHPHQTFGFATSATIAGMRTGSTSRMANINDEEERKIMSKWWKWDVAGCSVYEDGNLTADSSSDYTGVIAEEGALYMITSREYRQKTDEDISLRAKEVVVVADYGVGELDDTLGAGAQFDGNAPSDSL